MGQRRRAGCRCNCHCRWECVGRLLGASQLAAAAETWWAAALVGTRLCRAPSRCSCSAAAALAKRPWRVAAADTCTCARERPTKGWRGPLCGACFAVAAVAVGRRPPAQLGRSIRRRLRARRHCGEAALAWGKVCSRAVGPISHFHCQHPHRTATARPGRCSSHGGRVGVWVWRGPVLGGTRRPGRLVWGRCSHIRTLVLLLLLLQLGWP